MATVRVDGRTVRVKIHPIARPVVLPIRPQTTRVIMRNSVNGQQGTVVLTKSDVGLGNVDNTSDANKPISTATQTALDGKASTGYVDNAVAGVVNSAPAVLNTLGELAVALGNDPNFATTIAGQIGGKANAVHTHAIADTTGLQTALDSKAPQSTTYTKTEVDTALSGKAATSHTHTKAQVTDFAHTHPVAEVTGLGTAATKDVASSGDATAGQVVQGNDSRLSDSRTPTAHSHAQADVTGLVAALAGKVDTTGDQTIAGVKTFTSSPIAPSGTSIGGVLYLTGTGFPEGVVTAPVGSTYIDKAITNGASSWIKKSGTGSTGWQVLEGDTGWRNISGQINTAAFNVSNTDTSFIRIRRVGNTVHVLGRVDTVVSTTSSPYQMLTGLTSLSGFRVYAQYPPIVGLSASNAWNPVTNIAGRSAIGISSYQFAQFSSGLNISINQTYTTDEAWPTTLPGVPA